MVNSISFHVFCSGFNNEITSISVVVAVANMLPFEMEAFYLMKLLKMVASNVVHPTFDTAKMERIQIDIVPSIGFLWIFERHYEERKKKRKKKCKQQQQQKFLH